jgi:hypothetical protein
MKMELNLGRAPCLELSLGSAFIFSVFWLILPSPQNVNSNLDSKVFLSLNQSLSLEKNFTVSSVYFEFVVIFLKCVEIS